MKTKAAKLLAAGMCAAALLAGTPAGVQAEGVACEGLDGVRVKPPAQSWVERTAVDVRAINENCTTDIMKNADRCAQIQDIVRDKFTQWSVAGKNILNLDINQVKEAVMANLDKVIRKQVDKYCQYAYDQVASTLNILDGMLSIPEDIAKDAFDKTSNLIDTQYTIPYEARVPAGEASKWKNNIVKAMQFNVPQH